MTAKSLRPNGPGQDFEEYDVSVTTTTATETTVEATLTFDRPLVEAPSVISAEITGSTEGRLLKCGVDQLTTTSAKVWIRQGANAVTAGAKTVKVILAVQK